MYFSWFSYIFPIAEGKPYTIPLLLLDRKSLVSHFAIDGTHHWWVGMEIQLFIWYLVILKWGCSPYCWVMIGIVSIHPFFSVAIKVGQRGTTCSRLVMRTVSVWFPPIFWFWFLKNVQAWMFGHCLLEFCKSRSLGSSLSLCMHRLDP